MPLYFVGGSTWYPTDISEGEDVEGRILSATDITAAVKEFAEWYDEEYGISENETLKIEGFLLPKTIRSYNAAKEILSIMEVDKG